MSLRGFTLHSQRDQTPDDSYDHFIVLKDNTLPNGSSTTPPAANLSRATTNNLSNLSENNSPVTSAAVSRVQSIASLNDRVGTFHTVGSFNSVGGGSQISSNPAYVPGHKRKESLRKHLAERKYHREWKLEQNNPIGENSGKSSSNSSDNSSSDSDSDPSQLNGKDLKKVKRIDSRRYKEEIGKIKEFPTAVLTKKDEIQSRGTKALRKARQVGRRVRKEEIIDDAGELDILYENQRGTFFFGIPMFSAKSLLPVDSAPWTNRHHAPSAVNIFTAQVPDPSWTWAWKSFAVDMTGDVDEEGWQYSFAFRGTKWHGNAVWWHGFVRRRRWIRKRVKRRLPMNLDDAHHLTPEYFTIHSHASEADHRSGYYSSSILSLDRNSKLVEYPTATQESDDSEFEDYEIQDVPTLMRAFKRARLDREKIEALSNFLENGGSEVIYLADSMPKIMKAMIFQQSRRQILKVLLDTLEKSNDKRRSRALSNGAPKSPRSPRSPKSPKSPLGFPEEDFDDDEEKRYIDGLGRAVDAGEEEVRKLEFWSDIKKAEHEGYGGVENSGHHHESHLSKGKKVIKPDAYDSDHESANIWKARASISKKRKEQMAGKAKGEFAERDETDASTVDTDIEGSVKEKAKGKGRAAD